MDASIFLAKAIGFIYIVVAIMLFSKQKKVKVIVKEVCSDPAMLFMTGMISLVLGTLIVLFHNIWVWDWRLLITLIGWLAIVRGIVRTLFPHIAVKIMNKMIKKKDKYQAAAVIILVVGVVLSYYGFIVGSSI